MEISQIVFDRLGSVSIERTSVPELRPGAGEALIAPAYLGIRGTDLHVLHGTHPWVKPPLVTGNEVAATVLECGTGATNLAPRDRVVLNPLVSCGECRQCRHGTANHCENAKVIGCRVPVRRV